MYVWNVLLVLDDTEYAENALECAADLALGGLRSKVYLLYVKDEEPVAYPSEELERRKYAPLVAKANKKLLDAMEKLKKLGVNCEILGYHIGIAEEEVKRVEKELEPDLIIIGVKKKGILNKVFNGNYGEKVIFETSAPVVVVKPTYTPKIKEMVKDMLVVEIREGEKVRVRE